MSLQPRCLRWPTNQKSQTRYKDNVINSLKIGGDPAFSHSAATAAEAERHDAPGISHFKPDPEQPCPHVAHVDAQHRLDHCDLNRDDCTLRSPVRWLLGNSLIILWACGHATISLADISVNDIVAE